MSLVEVVISSDFTGEDRADVLIHSDHLIGLGHYVRVRKLVQTALKQGLRVVWLVGGEIPPALSPPDGALVVSLPTLYQNGRLLEDAVELRGRRAKRGATLQWYLGNFRPRIFLIETFPFGRFSLSLELINSLRFAKNMVPRPIVISSVRDFPTLAQDEDGRAEQILDIRALLVEFFDGVTWHADPHLINSETPLEQFVSPVPVWATGYVDAGTERRVEQPVRRTGLVAYAGSGALGNRLLCTVIEAARRGLLQGRKVSVVAGPRMASSELTRMLHRSKGVSSVVMYDVLADIRRLLFLAEIAICQAGYNTFLDILATEIPAVMVPVMESGDQPRRARILEQKSLIVSLDEEALSPELLGAAVERAITGKRPSLRVNCRGAQTTVELFQRWISLGAGD